MKETSIIAAIAIMVIGLMSIYTVQMDRDRSFYATLSDDYYRQLSDVRDQNVELNKSLYKSFSKMDKITNELDYYKSVVEILPVTITAYSPTVRETDSTPFITATNRFVSEEYIAASNDIIQRHGFGTKVYIPGVGIREIQDRMNRRWKSRIDLFFFNTQEAKKWGRLDDVSIIIL